MGRMMTKMGAAAMTMRLLVLVGVQLAIGCMRCERSCDRAPNSKRLVGGETDGVPKKADAGSAEEVAEFVKQLEALKPWGRVDDMTDRDWQQYRQVARRVQSSSAAVLRNVFSQYLIDMENSPAEEDDAGSRALLLLRFVFELPQSVSTTEMVFHGRWRPTPEPNPDGTMNLSWPVAWHEGLPRLISDFQGYEGRLYSPFTEYEYFSSRYPFRSFSD